MGICNTVSLFSPLLFSTQYSAISIDVMKVMNLFIFHSRNSQYQYNVSCSSKSIIIIAHKISLGLQWCTLHTGKNWSYNLSAVLWCKIKSLDLTILLYTNVQAICSTFSQISKYYVDTTVFPCQGGVIKRQIHASTRGRHRVKNGMYLKWMFTLKNFSSYWKSSLGLFGGNHAV